MGKVKDNTQKQVRFNQCYLYLSRSAHGPQQITTDTQQMHVNLYSRVTNTGQLSRGQHTPTII